MKKTIKDLDLKGKKVLIRVDFNVPIKNGVITSNKRILAALPTINFAIESGAKVILLSHLGRVKTQEDKKTKSLKIVAEELSKQLRQQVIFVPETRGKLLEDKINGMMPKEVLMIENTRFEDLNNSAESKNSRELGKYWASLGDVFINDAFGTVHRAHASNVGIAENIRESAVGLLVQEELSMLAKAIYGNQKPFVAIIGGAKISEKIKVIDNLINKVDYLIIGGGMAHTFCASQGLSIGSSLVEPDKISLAREYMKKYSHKIILPIDSAVSINFADNKPLFNRDNSLEIPAGYMGLDIGPKSVNVFRNVLSGAKTVLWNGPMGVAEFDHYKNGTESIANIIAAQPNVFSIIGGGDSAAAIINLGLEKKFSHISTGGGASLQFLEGGVLPGIEAIQEAPKRTLESNSNMPVNKPAMPASSTPSVSTLNKPALTQPTLVKPGTPATPASPAVNKPGMPTTATTPAVNKPATPASPTTPIKPGTPAQPTLVKPGTTASPTTPVKPATPAQPTLVKPGMPNTPTTPAQQNAPRPATPAPSAPRPAQAPTPVAQPVQKKRWFGLFGKSKPAPQPQPVVRPTTPVRPAAPVNPSLAPKPGMPTTPVKPGTTPNVVKPGMPTTPVKPGTTTTTPIKPGTPASPTTPVKPGTTATTPVSPASQVKPGTPATPTTPAMNKPGTPVTPAQNATKPVDVKPVQTNQPVTPAKPAEAPKSQGATQSIKMNQNSTQSIRTTATTPVKPVDQKNTKEIDLKKTDTIKPNTSSDKK